MFHNTIEKPFIQITTLHSISIKNLRKPILKKEPDFTLNVSFLLLLHVSIFVSLFKFGGASFAKVCNLQHRDIRGVGCKGEVDCPYYPYFQNDKKISKHLLTIY